MDICEGEIQTVLRCRAGRSRVRAARFGLVSDHAYSTIAALCTAHRKIDCGDAKLSCRLDGAARRVGDGTSTRHTHQSTHANTIATVEMVSHVIFSYLSA